MVWKDALQKVEREALKCVFQDPTTVKIGISLTDDKINGGCQP